MHFMRERTSNEAGSGRSRPVIGIVAGNLPAYDAEEHRIFDRSVEQLRELSNRLDFELVCLSGALRSRDDARAVARDVGQYGLDFLLFQHSTFVMGDLVLELIQSGVRIGLWATDEPAKFGPIPLNSFVSLNLSAGVLRRWLRERDLPFKWFHGNADTDDFVTRFSCTVDALRVVKRLRTARIGWVGGLAPTFHNIYFDESTLETRIGVGVTYLELDHVFARARSQEHAPVQRVVSQLHEAAGGRVAASPSAMDTSARVYLALRETAREYECDALAVRDWPEFQSELSIHPGTAFSWLEDRDRIPVASEGDVLGAVTQLAVNEATGASSLLLDMNDFDRETDSVLMWHCGGGPLWFADDNGFSWDNHSTIGRHDENAGELGAIADLKFRPGPVTVARIGASGTELFATDADIVDGPASGFHGSRGWFANFEAGGHSISVRDLLNTVFTEGLEHHFVVGTQRRSDVLYEAGNWLGMRTIETIPYRSHMQLPGTAPRGGRSSTP